jgi:hypothetical protein
VVVARLLQHQKLFDTKQKNLLLGEVHLIAHQGQDREEYFDDNYFPCRKSDRDREAAYLYGIG